MEDKNMKKINYVKIEDRFGRTIGASTFEAVANMFDITEDELKNMIEAHELIEKSNVFRSEAIRFSVATYQEVQLWQATLVSAWRCSKKLGRIHTNNSYSGKIVRKF